MMCLGAAHALGFGEVTLSYVEVDVYRGDREGPTTEPAS